MRRIYGRRAAQRRSKALPSAGFFSRLDDTIRTIKSIDLRLRCQVSGARPATTAERINTIAFLSRFRGESLRPPARTPARPDDERQTISSVP